ncbi:MAG TPA: hypothetical protein VGZ01_00765 [Trinickia sp.]|jgi:hypothetical protein|nr:hypothetical protein [Trinickia sp.]
MNTSSADHDLATLHPEEAKLRQWVAAWYHYAVSDGLIEPSYQLDDATAKRLEGYFKAGLAPGEGVGIVFGTLH